MNRRYAAISFVLAGALLWGILLMLSGPFSETTTIYARSAAITPTPTPHLGPAFVKPGGTGLACEQADPCGSVQMAIDRAIAGGWGDTIYIAGGTYTGTGTSVITISKPVTLYGGWDGAPTGPVVRDPDAYPSVLDGEGQRRVVYIYRDITTTLDGLVIAHGNATGLPYYEGQGGGILSEDATPIIVNCLITNNVAYAGNGTISGAGGGMRIVAPRGTAVISGNRILSNTASLRTLGGGGGIDLLSAPHAQVMNNLILSNTAAVSATNGYGGGLAIDGNSQGAIVSGNRIEGNVALVNCSGSCYGGGYGGGIDTGSSAVTITHNEILSNVAVITGTTGMGGGISILGGDDVVIEDNRVEHNVAQQQARNIPSNRGGGIYAMSNENLLIRGNTIRDNTASFFYTGAGGGIYLSSCSKATVAHNRIERNRASVEGNGYGGGFHAYASRGLRIEANDIVSNTATDAPWGRGGGLYFSRRTSFTMTNNIVANNNATREGGGVAFESNASQPVTGTMVFNTFMANNTQSGGTESTAIHLNDPYVTLVLTNNLIYSHTYGLYAIAGTTATLHTTLFYANSDGDIAGSGTITNTAPLTGSDPMLTADGHLHSGSPAIDAAVEIPWVTDDIDGHRRPYGPAPDIGADEFALHMLYLPLVLKRTP